mgnify:CR=1 FL=1
MIATIGRCIFSPKRLLEIEINMQTIVIWSVANPFGCAVLINILGNVFLRYSSIWLFLETFYGYVCTENYGLQIHNPMTHNIFLKEMVMHQKS